MNSIMSCTLLYLQALGRGFVLVLQPHYAWSHIACHTLIIHCQSEAMLEDRC